MVLTITFIAKSGENDHTKFLTLFALLEVKLLTTSFFELKILYYDQLSDMTKVKRMVQTNIGYPIFINLSLTFKRVVQTKRQFSKFLLINIQLIYIFGNCRGYGLWLLEV